MGHGRETILSLNLRTVCILKLNITCVYVTGHRGIRYSKLNFTAYRGASRKGKGDRGTKEKKNVYHFLFMISNMSRCRE